MYIMQDAQGFCFFLAGVNLEAYFMICDSCKVVLFITKEPTAAMELRDIKNRPRMNEIKSMTILENKKIVETSARSKDLKLPIRNWEEKNLLVYYSNHWKEYPLKLEMTKIRWGNGDRLPIKLTIRIQQTLQHQEPNNTCTQSCVLDFRKVFPTCVCLSILGEQLLWKKVWKFRSPRKILHF